MVEGLDFSGFVGVLFPVLAVIFGVFFLGLYANMALRAS
jgi:hypothetical protein